MREFPYSRRLLRIVPFEQRSLLSISDGETNTAYTYDSVGRLATVTSQAGTTTYSYDVYGNLAKVVTATGSGIITTTYEYDIMNRLTRLTNFSDANNNGVMDEGEGVSQFDYTLDALGKKTHATETLWFDNNEDGVKDANVNNIGWTYDQQSRLVREVFDHYDDQFDQTLDWTYDEVGNRLTQNLDKGNDSVIDEVTRYYIDANDRLIHELFDGQNDNTFEKTTHYDYDKTQQTAKTVTENGVITSDSTFEYNAVGQMSVVTITKYTDGVASSIERTTYGYGSDGIRVSALQEIDSNADGVYDTATLTEYLNDPNNHTGYSQVLKTTGYSIDGETRTITKEIYYTIGLDQIAQSVTAYIDGIAQETDHHYFTYDGHGSTRALLDVTAAILQLYSFDAYGNAIDFNPTEALTEYLYSGEQFDSKIGQQYLRARYYDPVTGRFNSLDSFFGNLDDPQSLHKYLYTHADPINGIDPSGLMSLGSCLSSIGIGMKTFAIAHPGITTVSVLGGAGIGYGYLSNSSGAWCEGFIPGWGAGRGLGQSLRANDTWGMIFNGTMLLLDFFSFGGGSLVFGSAKKAPKILDSIPDKTIEELCTALKKVAQNKEFRQRLIKHGYSISDINKILDRIVEYGTHVNGKTINVIEKGYPWIDDQMIALNKNSISKMHHLVHELTHLLDDIVTPDLLKHSREKTVSWLGIVKTEYNAWFTQSRFAWYTLGGSYYYLGVAYGGIGGFVTATANIYGTGSVFFILKNILYTSTTYSDFASEEQNKK